MVLRVDTEFRDLIPPLSSEERTGLEKSILEEGVRDPIVVWNGTIVDGHNRYEIANENDLTFSIVYKEFVSHDEAKLWIIGNQLGRRNLTRQQRNDLIGKEYNTRKKDSHARPGNKNAEKREGQNDPPDYDVAGGTADEVGAEYGVSPKSVKRASEYSEALDKLTKAFGQDFRQHVWSGTSKLSDTDVVMLAGELGKNDEVLYSAAELWAFGNTGTFKLAMLLARCRAECGERTHDALWQPAGDEAKVRVSASQLEHLLKMPDDETAADLVEIVESGQPIEDPKTGKMRVITSVQDAHKFRQEERKKAKREADRAVALELVRDSDQCTLTDEQDVIQCDALITDPPYGILASQGVGWDSFEDFEEFSREWLSRWNECGADFIVSFWSQRYLFEGRQWFDEELTNYEFTQILTWVYRNNKSPQSRTMFKQTWEPVFFYRRKDSDKQIRIEGGSWGEDLHDLDTHIAAVPQSNFNEVDTKEHPAQKPLSVMRWLVGATTRAGDLVVDPFCGSGTTGIAALQLERRFAGLELDPEYRTLAEGRLAQYGVA